jgi:dephospho-CoA kinase
MLVIGVTGGIGSGKSTVCEILKIHGLPVFNSDDQAKELYNDSSVKESLLSTFGIDFYVNGNVDRQLLAGHVFGSRERLSKLNEIIHPAVARRFIEWKSNCTSQLVVKEAAILFESGGNVDCDRVIVITAPNEIRIQRTMARNKISREEVIGRMAHQWLQEKTTKLADYVINNDGNHSLIYQVEKVLHQLKPIIETQED